METSSPLAPESTLNSSTSPLPTVTNKISYFYYYLLNSGWFELEMQSRLVVRHKQTSFLVSIVNLSPHFLLNLFLGGYYKARFCS